MSWLIKYRPKRISDIVGQHSAVEKLLDFLKNYKRYSKKAALLYGPPGTGKTSSVYALANELNLELIELNASDFRNKDVIHQIIGNAIGQRSLFFKQKIILIDEVDGVAGREDRGGLSEIAKIIKTTTVPIILTANDPFDSKFSSLRKLCLMIEFERLSYRSVLSFLKKVCAIENFSYEEEALKKIAINSHGDMRAALNDLFLIAAHNGKITEENLSVLPNRDIEETMMQALVKILKVKDFNVSRRAFDNVNVAPDEYILWVEENMLKEYEELDDIDRALDYLSKADIFMSRIKRWQYWRFLVYYLDFITAGVSLAKKEQYKKFVSYSRPTRMLTYWIYNNKYKLLNSALSKLADALMTSSQRIRRTMLPFIPYMIKANPEFSKYLKNDVGLTDEELIALTKN
ncbi:MAG: replication factor large subunit [Candidatus Woesearchaeota archaeon]|nr:replication factor large subunit [Candidatus Woesearchaeota archaeon]MDN5327552.1 replication factor large subunit [Candidatus Woesearchaeota archaeon]